MSDPHPFDRAIALEPAGAGTWAGATSPAYANMIGPYGGITAAQMLNAVLQAPDRLGEPVAFTINFTAAVVDGPFEIEARPVRTNRSTQHWNLALRQQGQTLATATAITALRRETFADREATMPQVPPPADVPRSTRRGVEWVNRYAVHTVVGDLPRQWNDADTGSTLSRLWLRDDPPRPLDFASLTALADVNFPRVWLRRARRVPTGTVSMTVFFLAGAEQLRAAGTGHLLQEVRSNGMRAGYFDQSALLWDDRGELLASSHQLVYYKE